MKAAPLSWWEYDSWVRNIDLIVIGSGIVGLNAAWQYKKLNPGHRVIVLERGLLPCGASTRNAGFACFGSVSELLSDISVSGEEKTFALVKERLEGLKLLRNNLGDDAIGYESYGDSEVFTEEQSELFEKCADSISWFNKSLKEITGLGETFRIDNSLIAANGFAKVRNLIYCPVEGQVDSGKLMLRLLNLATAAGVEVITGAEVKAWDKISDELEIHLENGHSFRSRKLLLATNAFSTRFFPELDLKPARGQVLITRPVEALKLRGIFHYDEGFYYFRNVGDRVLLGGARNKDFSGEETYDMQTSEMIQDSLKQLLQEVILPNQSFEIEMSWAGIMGMGSEKYYILRKLEDNIVVACRLSGMGVALGSKVGADAADLLSFS